MFLLPQSCVEFVGLRLVGNNAVTSKLLLLTCDCKIGTYPIRDGTVVV